MFQQFRKLYLSFIGVLIYVFDCYFLKIKLNQLHAVSRTQQGRQRELIVKTLRSPLSAEFRRHYVLSGRTQRRALHRHHSEEMEIKISSSGNRTHNQSVLQSHFVPLRQDALFINML